MGSKKKDKRLPISEHPFLGVRRVMFPSLNTGYSLQFRDFSNRHFSILNSIRIFAKITEHVKHTEKRDSKRPKIVGFTG